MMKVASTPKNALYVCVGIDRCRVSPPCFLLLSLESGRCTHARTHAQGVDAGERKDPAAHDHHEGEGEEEEAEDDDVVRLAPLVLAQKDLGEAPVLRHLVDEAVHADERREDGAWFVCGGVEGETGEGGGGCVKGGGAAMECRLSV